MSAATQNEFDRLRQDRDALRQRAQQAEEDNYALLRLVGKIREAAGDPTGKMMQPELIAHIREMREERDALQRLANCRAEQRDALAAHVVALSQHIENVNELSPVVWALRGASLIDDGPTTSLARQKLLWQVKAMEALACKCAGNREVHDRCMDEAKMLRRQAEEAD